LRFEWDVLVLGTAMRNTPLIAGVLDNILRQGFRRPVIRNLPYYSFPVVWSSSDLLEEGVETLGELADILNEKRQFASIDLGVAGQKCAFGAATERIIISILKEHGLHAGAGSVKQRQCALARTRFQG
jgi:hypothetical protein